MRLFLGRLLVRDGCRFLFEQGCRLLEDAAKFVLAVPVEIGLVAFVVHAADALEKKLAEVADRGGSRVEMRRLATSVTSLPSG